MKKFLKSKLIHCAVVDSEGNIFYPTTSKRTPCHYPYLYEFFFWTDKVPEHRQYNLWRTLFEFFNPFVKKYSPRTNNCVTFVADFCDLNLNGKRPEDVYTELLHIS